MTNKEVILEMYKSMLKGTKFVEIETYLKNHTTLQGYPRKVVRDNLSSIQKRLEIVDLLLKESLDFCQ